MTRIARHTRTQIVSVSRHGVITRRELHVLGLTDGQIGSLRRDGTLWVVHPGVYAVGRPDLTLYGRFLCAVLACGEGAVLSHRDGAFLTDLPVRRAARIAVTVPRRGTQRANGIAIHLTKRLHPDDVDEIHGIPCTGPERTLLDLADVLSLAALEKAAEFCLREKLLRVGHLHRQLSTPGRRIRKLERALRVEAKRTRSPLEDEFLALLSATGLPPPLVNVWFPEQRVEADLYWPAHGLVVEIDSRYHDTPHAEERDARKDQLLRGIGLTVLRVRRPGFRSFIAHELPRRLHVG